MSTPISEIRHEFEDADQDEHVDSRTPATCKRPRDSGDDDEEWGSDDESVSAVYCPPPRRRARTSPHCAKPRSYSKPVAPRADTHPAGTDIWRVLTSRAFCQAVVLAFGVICAVFMSPVASMLIQKVPGLPDTDLTHTTISALVAAVLVTATRPPAHA